MGLARDSVYIANILKCRPDTPGQSSGNRKPTSDEMQTCIPYLHEQIDLPQIDQSEIDGDFLGVRALRFGVDVQPLLWAIQAPS